MNKTKKQHGIMATIAIIAIGFAIVACDDGKDDNDNNDNDQELELVNKTYPITLKDTKDNDLVFTVKYKAYAIDPEPTYLAYLQTRLGAMAVNTSNTNILAVDNLVAMGGNFTVRVVAGNEAGFTWNSTTREFEVQHDWISTATDTDLSNLMMRNAFSSVQAE